MYSAGGGSVCRTCSLACFERAETTDAIVSGNVRNPALSALVKMNSFCTRQIVDGRGAIPKILGIRRLAQIAQSVVYAIAVFVVKKVTRPIPSDHQPNNPMRVVAPSINAHPQVTAGANVRSPARRRAFPTIARSSPVLGSYKNSSLARSAVSAVLGFFGIAALLLIAVIPARPATTLLPPAEQCFQTSAGPVSNGSVNMYFPNSTTPKVTWTNSSQSAANTQPIQLDANGCAIIYGVGSYRQQLWTGPVVGGSTTGLLVFDLVTTDTSAYNSIFWAGIAGGTPNAVVVQDPGFSATDGVVINFIPLYTNTSSVTLQTATGGTAYSIVKDTATGAVALTGGELVANSPSNVVSVIFSATQQNFHILNLVQPAAVATATPTPGGYLNLVGVAAGGPVQGSSDVTAATTVYYSPYHGNQIPVWNGASFTVLNFPELQLALSASAQASSTIYDIFIFNNNGSPVAVFGPAWATSTAGSGARGTGAGTTQLTYQSGILVNAVQISANNGSNTYTIPANEATYVGSVLVDGTAGQVSDYRTWGQTRKWGVWNAYNRVPICLLAGDSTSSWNYETITWRPSNNNTANSLTAFTGLAEETFQNTFTQRTLSEQGSGGVAGPSGAVGWNSTTVPSGTTFLNEIAAGTGAETLMTLTSVYTAPPALGAQTVTSLEESATTTGTATFYGSQTNMVLQACYRG